MIAGARDGHTNLIAHVPAVNRPGFGHLAYVGAAAVRAACPDRAGRPHIFDSAIVQARRAAFLSMLTCPLPLRTSLALR